MKLYLNCNYSGYHWFEIDDIRAKADVVPFEDAYSKPPCKTVTYLRSYVEHCPYLLMDSVENGEHVAVMMIGNIEETRTDEMGRRIKMFALLTGTADDLPLMHKLLLYGMTDKKGFDERFVSNIILGSSLCCNVSGLNAMIDDVAGYDVVSSRFAVKNFTANAQTKVYVLVSNKKDETLLQDIRFPKSELACKVSVADAVGQWVVAKSAEKPSKPGEIVIIDGHDIVDVPDKDSKKAGVAGKVISVFKKTWKYYLITFLVGFILGAIIF